jgi:hypothetical protein
MAHGACEDNGPFEPSAGPAAGVDAVGVGCDGSKSGCYLWGHCSTTSQLDRSDFQSIMGACEGAGASGPGWCSPGS